jgi:hypothetical protein
MQSAEEVGPELREMQEAIANAPKTSGYKDLLEPRILHRYTHPLHVRRFATALDSAQLVYLLRDVRS